MFVPVSLILFYHNVITSDPSRPSALSYPGCPISLLSPIPVVSFTEVCYTLVTPIRKQNTKRESTRTDVISGDHAESKKVVLLVTTIAAFFSSFGMSSVNIALPSICRVCKNAKSRRVNKSPNPYV